MSLVSQRESSIFEEKLHNWKLLDRFRHVLAAAERPRPAPELRAGGPERKLLEEDYFSLLLLGLLNPVVKTMRGLCGASRIERVQREVCGGTVSLGSFSEGQAVFDPQLLANVFLDLSKETAKSAKASGDPRLATLAAKLNAFDGSLLPALPRMHWALWVDENNRAAKLHLKFNVLRQQACEAMVTTGNASGRDALRKMIEPVEIAIAALLLQVFTGKRPSNRVRELLEFYFMGYIDADELAKLLQLEKNPARSSMGNRTVSVCRGCA